MRRILITARLDSMGNLHMAPESTRVHVAYREHMREVAGPGYGAKAFIQEVSDERLAELFTPRQRALLRGNYGASILMTPEEYGHLLGYDAHLVEV